jgi:hypothetical protein
MKTNTLKIDFESGKLIMDRTLAKAAAYVGSEEYNILQNARRDYPTFIVETRTIKRNPNKECYRGLTYEYMEAYIKRHDDEKQSRLAEYKELRILAKCHSIRYPHIKQWFLATFPEVEKFGTAETAETEKITEIENELSRMEKKMELLRGEQAEQQSAAA